jgi:hypothetical protein
MDAQGRTVPACLATRDVAAGDKAALLAALAPRVRTARVPAGVVVEFTRWREARVRVLGEVLQALRASRYAVRSARVDEDAAGAGGAGRWLTRLDVPPTGVAQAIDAVFASYDAPVPGDRVLLQPYVTGVRAALVASSHAPGDGAPYRTISRATGSDPAAITAGTVAAEVVYLAREPGVEPPRWACGALALLREVEALVPGQPFELELVQARGRPWLLQFRPLAAPVAEDARATGALRAARARAGRVLHRAVARRGPTLFGLMPDWNPAELLGEHPRPLALGLFEALVARGTWWRARAALGYRRPARDHLLVTLGGRPYVDIGASFTSLLPASLSDDDAAHAVGAWLALLAAHPERHDRVELEVALTCAEFDGRARLREAGVGGRVATRLCRALDALTRTAFMPAHVAAARRAAEIRTRRAWVAPHAPHALPGALLRLRREAARPFAVAARLDFIGAALLRSAARRGAIDPSLVDRLRAAAGTAAGSVRAAAAAGEPTLDAALRPGTFDIDAPSRPVSAVAGLSAPPCPPRPTPDLDDVDALLRAVGWSLDAATLLRMAEDAARARELGKLALARGLGALLSGLAGWGQLAGLDRAALGWLTPAELVRHADDPGRLREAIARARQRHAEEAPLRMPTLLARAEDLSVVACAANRPTFLGTTAAEGPVVRVDRATRFERITGGAVLLIESADPGYDGVFARAPAALLTAFGGPQSHMALRCVELGVPAALGLGTERLRRLAASARLRIDPTRAALQVLEAPA